MVILKQGTEILRNDVVSVEIRMDSMVGSRASSFQREGDQDAIHISLCVNVRHRNE